MTGQAKTQWDVLVIDDDPDFCLLLQTALPKSMTVRTFGTGEEGLEEAQKSSYDLIILDVMMPGIHGFHALDELRAAPKTKHTPIFVSSNLPRDEVEFKAAGNNAGYLDKQRPIKELTARICRALGA